LRTKEKTERDRSKAKYKANPVTGLGGFSSFYTSTFPRFLDIRLTDGGEVVGFTRGTSLTPRKRERKREVCKIDSKK
jgi:hypothetical protein